MGDLHGVVRITCQDGLFGLVLPVGQTTHLGAARLVVLRVTEQGLDASAVASHTSHQAHRCRSIDGEGLAGHVVLEVVVGLVLPVGVVDPSTRGDVVGGAQRLIGLGVDHVESLSTDLGVGHIGGAVVAGVLANDHHESLLGCPTEVLAEHVLVVLDLEVHGFSFS